MDKSIHDADIFSEIMKANDRRVVTNAIAYKSSFGRYTISIITVIEIVKGFWKLNRDDKIQQFMDKISSIELLTLDIHSGELAGRIYADLERVGKPIGRADPMVAAIALRHDVTLVTGNMSHYERIQKLGYSLRPQNWRA